MPQVPSTHAEFIAGVLAFTAMSMSIMTFIIRFAPIALLARLELPARRQQALPYLPPPVMAAIIAPPLFFAVGAPTIVPDLPRIAAAALAALIAWRTRSSLLTALGMLAFQGLQARRG